MARNFEATLTVTFSFTMPQRESEDSEDEANNRAEIIGKWLETLVSYPEVTNPIPRYLDRSSIDVGDFSAEER